MSDSPDKLEEAMVTLDNERRLGITLNTGQDVRDLVQWVDDDGEALGPKSYPFSVLDPHPHGH